MKKSLLYLLALPVLMLLLASCHSEEDDFIDRPDPKSLIIKGVARTSGGQPLPNIEVKLDFREASLVATKVRHKAKATTDKDGSYIMFFNLSDEEYQRLKEKLKSHTNTMIEKLSRYMQSSGKTYQDHYATLLHWYEKDEEELRKKTNDRSKAPTIEEYMIGDHL